MFSTFQILSHVNHSSNMASTALELALELNAAGQGPTLMMQQAWSKPGWRGWTPQPRTNDVAAFVAIYEISNTFKSHAVVIRCMRQ
jgi:hypothetical protein